MSLFKADNLESLEEFKDTDYKLGILEREQPEGAGSFFQKLMKNDFGIEGTLSSCLLYTSPSPRDLSTSRMPSSA